MQRIIGLLSSTPVEATLGVAGVVYAGLAARVLTSPGRAAVAWRRLGAAVAFADRCLADPSAPVAIGVLTAALVWWVWGSLRQVPVYHDERAYVLQAQIFAAGRWVAAAPPLSEFFQQFHVLVTPVVAAKYPPGHSLIMTPGIWFGLPGLVPVLLSATTGALVFALPRRRLNGWIGLLAWWMWITEGQNLMWRASYFSEVTTSAVWMVSWWLLMEWRARKRWPLLVGLATTVGWGAITRPLTTVALAIPIAVVVLADIVRSRRFAQLGPAFVVGAAMVAVIPVWSSHTTGDWTLTPLALYTRTYIPWDHPGFGLDTTPPVRALRPDQILPDTVYKTFNREHTVRAVPRIAIERLQGIATDADRDWRKALALFALVGLCLAPAEGYFAVVTAGLLFVAYLSYVQSSTWTIYYLELVPVVMWLAALGCWRTLVVLAPGALPPDGRGRPTAPRAAVGVVLLVLATLPFVESDVSGSKRYTVSHTAYQRAFNRQVAALSTKAIVFVRYGPGHNDHISLVGNVPDVAAAHAWIAYDRGDTNAELMSAAPDRVPYLFDDADSTLSVMTRPQRAP